MRNWCRCGDEIEAYELENYWNSFHIGDTVWITVSSSNPDVERGRAVCSNIDSAMRNGIWRNDQLHQPLVMLVEEIIAALKEMERSLR